MTSAVPEDPIVVDLGMHQGAFSRAIEQLRPQARIFGIEPQPDLAQALSARYGDHAVQAAVGGKAGDEHVLQLFGSTNAATIRPSSERFDRDDLCGSVSVPMTSLPALMNRWQLDAIDLLKVDVEGAEIDLLSAGPADFSFVRQISVEFHAWRFPGDRAKIAELIRRFRSSGWIVQDFSRSFYDVLFLNPALDANAFALRGTRLVMGAIKRARRLDPA